MKKLKKSSLFIILAVFIVGCSLVFYYLTDGKSEKVAYKDFYEQVKENKIEKADIGPKEISYKLKDSEIEYKTINPDSSSLKEELLLNGVEVKESKGGEEIFSLIFDLIFYAIFFTIIATVFTKFISPNTFKTVHKTGVKFDDIIGMKEVKRDMMQIVQIMQNPKDFQKRGIRLPKGILLEGDPGNGKTLFARALAGEAKVNFIPAKATDFESMFMAIGPMKVKLLFKKARRKAPCIVFIDEFDGIGTKRNYSGSAIETENTRIVTALLNELDGFTPNSGIVVIAATNNRESLDPALIRPGRFDAKYKVPYPEYNDRLELVKLYSGNKTFKDDCRPEILAKKFEGFSCAQIESVLNKAALIAQKEGQAEYSMAEIQLALKEL
ncbi:MAG: ATP-dependent metallopeptidase FtsH/Yme1/Tma family protein [Treponemataceae bacterium]|nr:ATP-dependent metallopeptidase FtsH/Yme1/Tma family protein [Treponemataceae bacterium]